MRRNNKMYVQTQWKWCLCYYSQSHSTHIEMENFEGKNQIMCRCESAILLLFHQIIVSKLHTSHTKILIYVSWSCSKLDYSCWMGARPTTTPQLKHMPKVKKIVFAFKLSSAIITIIIAIDFYFSCHF